MDSSQHPGPTRQEQAGCLTLEALRALFERYGAEPRAAELRAKHVMEARERRQRLGRKFKTIYRRRGR